jgi:hypothetical protein
MKSELQGSNAIASVIVRFNLELEISPLRIEEWEQLSIGQKDIYVVTFAMIDPKHHRGTTAERPIDDWMRGIDLLD